MEMRKFNEVERFGNDMESWAIINEWGNTRNGFKHISTLLHYGNEVAKNNTCYLNRTWESYTYQTSMKNVVACYVREIKNRIVDNYKNENNVARLTKNHKANIEKLIADNVTLQQLAEIYKQLDYSR